MRTKPIPIPLTQSPQPDPPLGEELAPEERAQSSTGATSSTDPDPDPDVALLPSATASNGPWDDGEEAILSSSNGDCDMALDLSLAKATNEDDMDEEMAEMAFYDDEDGHSSSPGMEMNGEGNTPPGPPLVSTPTSVPGPLPDMKDAQPVLKDGPPPVLCRPSIHGPLPAHCSPSSAGPTTLMHGGDSLRTGPQTLSLNDTISGEQGRLCPVCHKVFRFEKNLYRHMQKAHAAGDGESVLKCKLCNYTTKHYSNMYVHIRTHTGDKPYWCSACGASFTQGSSLKLHIRSRHQENMSFFSLTKKYGKNNLTKLWTRVLKKDLPKFTSPFNHNAAAAAAAAAVLENAKAMGRGQVAGGSGTNFFFPSGYGNAPGLPPFSYFSPVAAAAAAAAASGIVFPNGSGPGASGGHPPPPHQPFFLGPPPPPPPPPHQERHGIKNEGLVPSPAGIKPEPGVLTPFESDNPPPLGVLGVKGPPPLQQQPSPMPNMAPGVPPHPLSLPSGPSHITDCPSTLPSSQPGIFPSPPFFSNGGSPFLQPGRHMVGSNGTPGPHPLSNGCGTPGLIPGKNNNNNNNENNNNKSGNEVACSCVGPCICASDSGRMDKSLQVGLAESAAMTALRQEQELLHGKLDRLRDSAKRLLLSLYSRSLASATAVRELRGEKIDDLMEHAAKTASSLETTMPMGQAYE